MKTRTSILVAALLAVVSVAGAQVPARVVMGGRAVTLVADAVYAFPAARSRIVAVGGTDQGIGVFLETVTPGFSALPSFDRQAGVETYASHRPDLVILKSSLKKTLGAGLETLGIKTAYLSLESPEEYYAELVTIGQIFNDVPRATVLASSAAAGRAGAKARVLLVQSAGEGFEVPPDTWIQTRLVEMAGGVAVWKGSNPGSGWATVGPEQIAAWNPDVLVVVSYKERSDAVAARMASDPRFSGLKAVKSGRIVGFAQDFVSWDQPDTRWGLGLLWLTDVVYPGSMAGYSTVAEARRFFSLFYGFSPAAFDAQIGNKLRGTK